MTTINKNHYGFTSEGFPVMIVLPYFSENDSTNCILVRIDSNSNRDILEHLSKVLDSNHVQKLENPYDTIMNSKLNSGKYLLRELHNNNMLLKYDNRNVRVIKNNKETSLNEVANMLIQQEKTQVQVLAQGFTPPKEPSILDTYDIPVHKPEPLVLNTDEERQQHINQLKSHAQYLREQASIMLEQAEQTEKKLQAVLLENSIDENTKNNVVNIELEKNKQDNKTVGKRGRPRKSAT